MNEALTSSTTSTSSSTSSTAAILLNKQAMPVEEFIKEQRNDANNKKSLNLNEILQIFNSAISQEQAWAALYQILNEFKYLFENYMNLVYLNQDAISVKNVCFRKDGTIYLNLANYNIQELCSINTDELDKHKLEIKILKSIAYLIYDALDYGNKFENEPDLQSSLADLLLLISGHYNEYSHKASEYDEGYEQEDEDAIISIDRALLICMNNVTEAEYHYKAVCRALYAQAYELKVFLEKIVESKNAILMNGNHKDEAHYCFEILNKADWAKLWMQVIHELRNGVKLRKVCEINQHHRHIEYELTPFEILLDQIRSKRYHLRKVVFDNSLAPEIKKDARDIILEFIRSRPPLKPVIRASANLNIRSEPLSIHEKLMQSIRTYSTPLRKALSQTDNYNNNSNENLNSTMNSVNNSKNKVAATTKRLLKADKNISNISDDEELDEKDLIYIENISNIKFESNNYMNYTFNGSFVNQNAYKNEQVQSNGCFNDSITSGNNQQRKRLKPGDALIKSPLSTWNEPIEDWRALVTEDIFDARQQQHHQKQPQTPSRRYTMNIFDMSKNLASLNIFSSTKANKSRQSNSNSNNEAKQREKVSNKWKLAKSRLLSPVYMKSGPGYHDFGFVTLQEIVKKLNSSNDCLQLTFDELCHIRNVLTKAELDFLLFDNRLYCDVSRGKICFSCRKTRFHLFNWGSKCRICKQRVCKKCLRNAQLTNGVITQVNVPLSKLCPAKFSKKSESNSDSNNNSINDNDSEEMSIEDDDDDDTSQQSDNQSASEITEDHPNQMEYFEICVDCYEIMNGVILKPDAIAVAAASEVKIANHDEDRALSPELLTMQPLYTRLTTPSTPVIPTIKTTTATPMTSLSININDESNEQANDKNTSIRSKVSRNHLKLDLNPVYTSLQIKNA